MIVLIRYEFTRMTLIVIELRSYRSTDPDSYRGTEGWWFCFNAKSSKFHSHSLLFFLYRTNVNNL